MVSTQVQSLLSSSEIQSLIQQANAANQLPAATLQTQETPLKAQISALGKVQSALSGLQSALSQLSNIGSLTQRTVTTTPSGHTFSNRTRKSIASSHTLG
ncbi:MAG TPA: flagellar cap protein FliD N-terminal domain-containing protein [Stellaceae bacterium]|nr:flagellar cap protein FliD N-terminal domain-containing protein [Stellaceae bacterium]